MHHDSRVDRHLDRLVEDKVRVGRAGGGFASDALGHVGPVLAVGHQEAITKLHRAVGDDTRRSLHDSRLNLTKLDAHSTNFDLVVEPPHNLKLSIQKPPTIACSIPSPRQVRELNELCSCEFRSVVVSWQTTRQNRWQVPPL